MAARLARGEAVIAVAGPLLFVCTFLPWFKVTSAIPTGTQSQIRLVVTTSSANAWDAGALWGLAGVLGLVAAGLVILPRFTASGPPADRFATLVVVTAGIGAILVLLKLAAGASVDLSSYPASIRPLFERATQVTRQWGIYLSAVVAVVLLIGCGLVLRSRTARDA
jgi:hypothetical protein